jgi:hypothetical protein
VAKHALLCFRHSAASVIVAALAAYMASSVKAASNSEERPRIYERRSAEVPLQPFTFDPPVETRRAIRVAYYAPRPIPHVQLDDAEEEADDDRPMELRGARATVPGNRAVLHNGIAYAPANAPERVKQAIWAVNAIRHKPYHWGGGHGSFYDDGYDCSGAVSFALHYAGVLGQPLPSSDFLRYGERGRGRWITIYTRHGHTFAVIAGLRLDTTDFRYGGDVGPRWYTEGRSTWGFRARHPMGL